VTAPQALHRFRIAMALAAWGCLAWACQGDYPIAPTVCDDWCRASDHVRCGDYSRDPAACVADCENFQKPSTPECMTKFRNVIDCLNQAPPTNDYCGQQAPVCAAEYAALVGCTGMSGGPME
jgi:hypothetical protein